MVMKCPLRSTIWLSLKGTLSFVLGSSQWIPRLRSNISFWHDNLLGYRIIDNIIMDHHGKKGLVDKVSSFFMDGKQVKTLSTIILNSIRKDIDHIKFGLKDVFVCKLAKERKPTIKDLYNALHTEIDDNVWGKEIWKHFIPPSRSFEFWRYLYRRTLVEATFKKQRYEMATRCVLCRKEEKNILHLFSHCEFSCALWRFLVELFEQYPLSWEPWEQFKEIKGRALSSQLWPLWQVGFFEVV